jgi:hypothetical protein
MRGISTSTQEQGYEERFLLNQEAPSYLFAEIYKSRAKISLSRYFRSRYNNLVEKNAIIV